LKKSLLDNSYTLIEDIISNIVEMLNRPYQDGAQMNLGLVLFLLLNVHKTYLTFI